MRVIEMEMLGAIVARKNWRKSNTEVLFDRDGNGFGVYLHHNFIARGVSVNHSFQITYATLAGWDTVTTRSRLRALGVDVPQLRRDEGYIQPRKPRKPRQPRIEDNDFDI